jgi:hypothetical protein
LLRNCISCIALLAVKPRISLNSEELRNEVFLLKDECGNRTWHIASDEGRVDVLAKLRERAKELQLIPEQLVNEVLFSKCPGTRLQRRIQVP